METAATYWRFPFGQAWTSFFCNETKKGQHKNNVYITIPQTKCKKLVIAIIAIVVAGDAQLLLQ